MEVSHINCFEGAEGVYYNHDLDEIFILSNKQFGIASTGVQIKSFYTYDIEYHKEIFIKKVIIDDGNGVSFLGEL